jgi:hypothetical protein
LLLVAARAWLMPCWICPRCRRAHGWKPPCRSVTVNRWSACGSGPMTPPAARPAPPRWWTRKYPRAANRDLTKSLVKRPHREHYCPCGARAANWRSLAGLSVCPCARSARTPRSLRNRPGGAISPYGRMGHGVQRRQPRDGQPAGSAAMRWPAAATPAAGQIEKPTCSTSLLLPVWKPAPSSPVAN